MTWQAVMPAHSAPAAQSDDRSRASRRLGAIAAFALGFFAFLPYPAIPAGNNTAVQMGSLVAILLVLPLFWTSWKRQPFYLFILLLLPLCTSAAKVAITGQAGLDVSLKAVLTYALPCVTLLPAMYYAPRRSLQMMTGVALATILHVLVGCWQQYAFLTGGQFPLLFLYQNPSFLSVAEQADTIVRYIQRPFGLFPEPSAMSSSLAPWVLIWIAEMCGLLRFSVTPGRFQRCLFALAALGGLALIVSSRSGHAMVTIAAVLLFGIAWMATARASIRNYLVMVIVFGLILPVAVWLTVLALGDRIGGVSGTNQSWLDRSESLVIGFRLWTQGGPASLLCGLGWGLSAPMLSEHYALDAVWSVLLTYVYETGLIGAATVAWFAVQLFRTWRNACFSTVWAAVLFVWLVGVTLTTSYGQLLPIWLTLGTLLVWPQVFPVGNKTSDHKRSRRDSRVSAGAPKVPARDSDLSQTPWGDSWDPA